MNTKHADNPELEGLKSPLAWLYAFGFFAVTVGLPAVIEAWL